MSKNIEVINMSGDSLERQTYSFWINDNLELLMHRFSIETRESKRHKFVTKQLWSFNNRRSNTIKERPIVSDSVKERAINIAKDMIKIVER